MNKHIYTNDMLHEVYTGRMPEEEFLRTYTEKVNAAPIIAIPLEYYNSITPAMWEKMQSIGKRDLAFQNWLSEKEALKLLNGLGD